MIPRTVNIVPPKYFAVTVEAMCDDESPPILRLDAARNVDLNVEAYRAELVAAAREGGASWDQIGAALGVTRQAAYARYGLKNAGQA